MLTLTPKPLSPSESKALRDWLDDKSRVVLERVLRNEIASLYVRAANEELMFTLNVIAKGEQPLGARKMTIQAARLKICLDVLKELPEEFELYDFSVG